MQIRPIVEYFKSKTLKENKSKYILFSFVNNKRLFQQK